jgi:hypothetical protein
VAGVNGPGFISVAGFGKCARGGSARSGYTARMSAQTSPAGPAKPPERTPAAIRAELPDDLRGQFDAEYHAALEEARVSYRLDRLNVVIQAWWQLVWARRSPRHEQAAETGRRLLRNEAVETFPVDLDALRP